MADPSATGRPAVSGARLAMVRRASEVAGPRDGPALVLLHGTRRTRSMWRHQVSDLSDAYHVVAVDLPGHGTLIDVPFRLSDAAAFVGDVIEQLAGGRAIIVGQSLGSYVAMELAARRPERVAGLVLATATAEPRRVARSAPGAVGGYLLGAAGNRLRGRPNTGRMPGPGTTEAVGGPTRRSTDGDPTEEESSPATSGWLFKGGTRALVSALGMTFIPRLAAYPGPSLIVNGIDDEIFRLDEKAFVEAAVDARLVVIPGTGHLVNEEQPAAFNAAVRRFATEVITRGSRDRA